jgi:hypothetical protein
MSGVLFERDGDRFVPTELALGPWSPNALHGGPPAALLARAVERMDEGRGLFVARITFELLRPVPRAPLTVTTRVVRPGRKVQLLEATLAEGGKDVVRATALLIRQIELPLPADRPERRATMDPVDAGILSARLKSRTGMKGFHSHATEHRFVRGQHEERGPSADWIRLTVPLLEGEEPSPLSRVCAAADFGNGTSSVLPVEYSYINPDLTVYLHRLPQGEWICLDASSRIEETGIGLAESLLFDRNGPIGRSVQSLIVDRLEVR